mmetsp:Transcript_6497/g.24415  ORF Transcript_6497/g.24415 Transcript_6497/m.24415 type:complete len:436 (-) Transcript_6497:21-1328(-)
MTHHFSYLAQISSFFSSSPPSSSAPDHLPLQNIISLLSIILITVFLMRRFEREKRRRWKRKYEERIRDEVDKRVKEELNAKPTHFNKSEGLSCPLKHEHSGTGASSTLVPPFIASPEFPHNQSEALISHHSLLRSLHKSNELFLKHYAKTKEAKVQRMCGMPLIVVSDEMALYMRKESFDGNQPDEASPFMSDWYDLMKCVDHVPLNIYAILSLKFPLQSNWHRFAREELRLTEDMRQALVESAEMQRELIDDFTKCASESKGNNESAILPVEVVERQLRIVRRTLEYVEKILKSGRTTAQDFTQVTEDVRTDLEENITSAAVAQINMMHNVIQKWDKKYPNLLQQAHIIIHANHFASRSNIVRLFFEKVLHTSESTSQRIISTDSDPTTWDELLGVVAADTQVSHAFFSTGSRMHKDLLSPAATRYLGLKENER